MVVLSRRKTQQKTNTARGSIFRARSPGLSALTPSTAIIATGVDALTLIWFRCTAGDSDSTGAGPRGPAGPPAGESHELRVIWEAFWTNYPPQYPLHVIRLEKLCRQLATAPAFCAMYRAQWRDYLRARPILRKVGDVTQTIAFLGLRSCRYWACDAALIALCRRHLAGYVRSEPEPGYSGVRLSPAERQLKTVILSVMNPAVLSLETYVSEHFVELKLQALSALGWNERRYSTVLAGLLRKNKAGTVRSTDEMNVEPELRTEAAGPCAESLWTARQRRNLLDYALSRGVISPDARGFWEQFLNLRVERWDEWGFFEHAAQAFGLPANTVEQRFRRFCQKLNQALKTDKLTPEDLLL